MKRLFALILTPLFAALPCSAALYMPTLIAPDIPSVNAWALNAHGDVGGTADNHPFAYIDGALTIFSGFGTVTSINDHRDFLNGQTLTHADGSTEIIPFGFNSEVINNAGQIVGNNGFNGTLHIYQNGITTDTGIFFPRATAINSQGHIAGSTGVGGHALFFANNSVVDLNPSLHADFSEAFGINDLDQVVGFASFDASGRAFLAGPNNAVTILPTFGGHSIAYDINNLGDVVGYSYTPSKQQRGFIYSNGILRNLNTLLAQPLDPDPDFFYTIVNARAINDSGQIIVDAQSGSGPSRAYLLTPIPEPASLLLLSLAAPLALHRQRQKGSSHLMKH